MIAFSRLYVTGQCECLLHCEHGCSVDTTQLVQLIAVGCLVCLVQLIAVGCLVMGEVGSAAVRMVILCLRKSVLTALSVVFLSHVTSICFCDHQL